MSVISALERLKKWDLWVQNYPGLHSKLQVDLAPNFNKKVLEFYFIFETGADYAISLGFSM